MSRASRGQAALIARLRAAHAPDGALTYVRLAERIDLTGKAWLGRTVTTRLANAGGAAAVFGDRDYLIPKGELPWEPKKGDVVEDVVNGVAQKFEVLPPATGEPEWRYSDPGETLFRVHCKHKGTA
ncbi:unnamed protein product [Gemmata massiliana]|uniref:Phage head-tail joining protein domain-containing protein n=1 Tax=Gemmata massiliana TaxID=1210884 RepID=A0A6P2DBV0_9BACT|nr:hypothetical protein [Gemmata massiliana]VTR99243.1 unnamed protein product [Gemmata massiliana]